MRETEEFAQQWREMAAQLHAFSYRIPIEEARRQVEFNQWIEDVAQMLARTHGITVEAARERVEQAAQRRRIPRLPSPKD